MLLLLITAILCVFPICFLVMILLRFHLVVRRCHALTVATLLHTVVVVLLLVLVLVLVFVVIVGGYFCKLSVTASFCTCNFPVTTTNNCKHNSNWNVIALIMYPTGRKHA